MTTSSQRPPGAASDAFQHAGRGLEPVVSPPADIYEALIECVRSAGGSKVVAAELWPAVASRNLEEARRRLANCLSSERAEKLSLDEILTVARVARDRGCHALMGFLCRELGYQETHPIEPEDERAKLQREFIESTKALARMAQRIESLERPGLRSAA